MVGLALSLGLFARTQAAGDAPTTGSAYAPNAAPALSDARALLLQGYYPRAEERFRLLAADQKTHLEAVLGLVECYVQTGRYDEAQGALDSVADAGTKSGRWHLWRAELAVCVGQYNAAVEHAERALKLDKSLWRARLLAAETLELLGRRDEALKQYAWFDRLMATELPSDAESLVAVGQGFYRFSVLTQHSGLARRTRHVLNQIFQVAYTQVDPQYWPARAAAADLLREKYNLDEAEGDYRAALAINSNAADALVGRGWIALERWDFEEVERYAHAALGTNPRHLGALHLLAADKILERRYDQAFAACQTALSVNPNDVEAMALAAGAKLAVQAQAEAAELVKRAEQVNPRSAALHLILADTLSGLRQYEEAERHYLAAIEAEPSEAGPRTALGLTYMEWGEEDKARSVLDAAWKLDSFNERTKNTLELLDKLAAFDAITTEHFVVRVNKATDGIVGQYASTYLESIYGELCGLFGAEMPRRTIIEIFPAHTDFAVRVTGKPWIHTVGACTGWVIAIESPRAGSGLSGPFNFAEVLRHEFTHTVTLAATRNRVPHWLTEGLAVREQQQPISFEDKGLLADSIRRGEPFTLETIDWGFMRPRRGQDRQRAYAHSAWMVEYLVGTFGEGVIGKLLAGFAEGRPQGDILARSIGIGPEEFDRRFAAWAGEQARPWGFDSAPPENVYKMRGLALLKPDDAAVQARLAKAELDAENWAKAREAAERAIKLDEVNAGGTEVLIQALARLAGETQDEPTRRQYEEQMLALSERLAALQPDNWTALKTAALIRLHRKEPENAAPWLERLRAACPADPFAAGQLGLIYYDQNRLDEAMAQLAVAAASEAHNPEIPSRLAEIQERRQEPQEARRWLQQALYIDPFRKDFHERIAKLAMRLGDTAGAIGEYRMLCELAPDSAPYHTDCALALHKLGDREQARRFAGRAVELDPNSPAAALLTGSGSAPDRQPP